MEWMDGCKLTDLGGLRDAHLHSRDVGIELLHAFAQMTFVDGFGRSVSPVLSRTAKPLAQPSYRGKLCSAPD